MCAEMPFNPLDYPVCLSYPKRTAPSSWIGHVPFGMFLVDALRPRTLVELGTYYGVSYCAFCQSVQEVGAATKCYAIDTWQGDPQAGYFGTDVLANLQAYHDPLYASFSRLIQSSFQEAAKSFEDGSIDLLHVDGFHSYDSVRQDYETWVTKMSANGVMLFHDTQVREDGFGVWRLWEELKAKHPHFEFCHAQGLGLVVVGAVPPRGLRSLLGADNCEAVRIKGFFERLGGLLERDANDRATIATGERRIRELDAFVAQVRRNPFFRLYHWAKYRGRQ